MRTDYDLLSTAPPEEPCVQGSDDPQKAREEGRRYIDLIRRVCGGEPEGATLRVRANPHDLGTYYSVALFFDESDPVHVEYMRKVDSEGPIDWNDVEPR